MDYNCEVHHLNIEGINDNFCDTDSQLTANESIVTSMCYNNTIITCLDDIKQQLTKNTKKIVNLESSLASILQQSLSPILIKLNDVESCVKQINDKQIKKDLENTKQELIKTKSDFEIMKNEFFQHLAIKDEKVIELEKNIAKKDDEIDYLANKISQFEINFDKLRNDCEFNLENTKQELIKSKSNFEIMKYEFIHKMTLKDLKVNEIEKNIALKDDENDKLVNKISDFESKLEKLRNDFENNKQTIKQKFYSNNSEILENNRKFGNRLEQTLLKKLCEIETELETQKSENKKINLEINEMSGNVVFEFDKTSNRYHRVAKKVDTNTTIGSVATFNGLIPGVNWLKTKGQYMSRAQYADLYEIIGSKYGNGNGRTNFGLPSFGDDYYIKFN